jgi:hypothetical protein
VFDRCPQAWLRDEAAEAVDAIEDVQALDADGMMPGPGGRLDQSPRFLEAIPIVREQRVLVSKSRTTPGVEH